MSSFKPNHFECSICGTFCNTLEQLELHNKGTKHIKKLTSHRLTSLQASSFGLRSDVSPALSKTFVEASKPNHFDCTICGTFCNTLEQLEHHKKGTQHLKNLNYQNNSDSKNSFMLGTTSSLASVEANLFRCTICNIGCNTQEQLGYHNKGKAHIKKANVYSLRQTWDQPTSSSFSSLQSSSSSSGVTDSSVLKSASNPFGVSEKSFGNSQSSELYYTTKNLSASHFRDPTDDYMLDFSNIPVVSTSSSNIPPPPFISDDSNKEDDLFQLPSLPARRNETPSIPSQSILSSMGGCSRDSVGAPKDDRKLTPCALSMSRGHVEPMGQEFNCKICNVPCNTEYQMSIHVSSKKHAKKLKGRGISPDIASAVIPISESVDVLTSSLSNMSMKDLDPVISDAISNRVVALVTYPEDTFHCFVCSQTMHGNNVLAHLNGKDHRSRFVTWCANTGSKQGKTTPASHNVVKEITNPFNLSPPTMKFEPRDYQIEVFREAMRSDCIVFMPTGTGKTLVACMIIVQMLNLNPSRQVVFLVDKVLLVLQQAEVIRQQCQDILIKRINESCPNRSAHKRAIRLAAMCGDHVEMEYKFPLAQQDIIVVTAAFYRNLLGKGSVRWADLCLAVFDEAHHCTKDHPYNKLLREAHLADTSSENSNMNCSSMPSDTNNCKIVGLTASPAGALSPDRTQKRMKELLEDMGGLKMVSVLDNRDELFKYIPLVNIEPRVVELLPHESKLRIALVQYLRGLLHSQLSMVSSGIPNMSSMRTGLMDCFIVIPHSCTFELSCEDLSNLRSYLDKMKNYYMNDENINPNFITLVDHSQYIAQFIDSIDSVGWNQVEPLITELFSDKVLSRASFSSVARMHSNTQALVQKLKDKVETIRHSVDEKYSIDLTSIPQELLREVQKMDKTKDKNKKFLILILCRERILVWGLTHLLETETDLSVQALVGHGATSKSNLDKGMTVKTQKRALNDIKAHKFQVVVATSVAEEGIDLPSCDLVILLNPPTSVKALVQMRGRARSLQSRFLVLCRESNDVDLLKQLEQRERHMIQVASDLSQSFRKS